MSETFTQFICDSDSCLCASGPETNVWDECCCSHNGERGGDAACGACHAPMHEIDFATGEPTEAGTP